MDTQLPEAFIMMKAGSHVGECLDCILKRKKRELKGPEERIFWGYGGNRLLPEKVQTFAKQRGNVKGPVKLLMPLTRAEERARQKREKNPDAACHQCQPKLRDRAVKYSKDEKKWDRVDEKINVPVSKYALVLGKIKPVHLQLDRRQFDVVIGLGKTRSAAEYGGNSWFDHACLVKAASPHDMSNAPKKVTVAYQARLLPPYAVFLG